MTRLTYAFAGSLCILASACGALNEVITPRGGAGESSTVSLLASHGLPDLKALAPLLPAEVGSDESAEVATDATGLPLEMPASVAGSFATSMNANVLAASISEAHLLARQGFAESRRAQALFLNFVSQVWDSLRVPGLFEQESQGALPQRFLSPMPGRTTHSTSASSSATAVFEWLLQSTALTLALPQKAGFPSHLVLSGSGKGVTIEALWPQGDSLRTGMMVDLSLSSLSSGSLGLAFAPGIMGGAVSEWKLQSCADDLIEIRVDRKSESAATLALGSANCQQSEDARAQLTVTQNQDGLHLAGAFARNVDTSNVSGFRKWLGQRLGFALQTGISANNVAASAAVLAAGDFEQDSQGVFSTFGVTQMLTRYFLHEFRTNHANNSPAYWLCDGYSGGIAQGLSESIRNLCSNEDLSSRSLVLQLADARKSIAGNALARSVIPSDVLNWLTSVIQVLEIRNPMFLQQGEETRYDSAPTPAFQTALSLSQSAQVARIADLARPAGKLTDQFRTVRANDLPTVAFRGKASALDAFAESARKNVLAVVNGE